MDSHYALESAVLQHNLIKMSINTALWLVAADFADLMASARFNCGEYAWCRLMRVAKLSRSARSNVDRRRGLKFAELTEAASV